MYLNPKAPKFILYLRLMYGRGNRPIEHAHMPFKSLKESHLHHTLSHLGLPQQTVKFSGPLILR